MSDGVSSSISSAAAMPPAARALLEGLPGQVAVLDRAGTLIAVNAGWRTSRKTMARHRPKISPRE